MMETILKEFGNYGITGVLLAWLFWKDWKMTTKLFRVIENNTQAMTKLTDKLEAKND